MKTPSALRGTGKDFKLGVFIFSSQEGLLERFTPVDNRSSKSRLHRDDRDSVYVVVSSSADDPAKAAELDKKLRRPVIDPDTGQLDPEDWGMKEIKIAAAFIAHEDLSACDSESPQFIVAGSIAWPGEETHLGYCIVMPKHYYVGAIENNGAQRTLVRTGSSLKEVGNRPFLFAARSSLPGTKSAAEKLPARVLFTGEQDPTLPFPPYCHAAALRLPEPDEREEQRFVLKVYDQWLQRLLLRAAPEKNKPSLSIYFEDKAKAEEWRQTFLRERLPDWASGIDFPQVKPENESPGAYADVFSCKRGHCEPWAPPSPGFPTIFFGECGAFLLTIH